MIVTIKIIIQKKFFKIINKNKFFINFIEKFANKGLNNNY